MSLSIGEIAKSAGTKVQTIRYYEEIGLMPEPARNAGNQRIYAEDDRQRLTFIRHARALGFGIEAIRDLLSLSENPDQSCEAADAIVYAQIAEVEAKIARLTDLRAELVRMTDHCGGAKVAQCRVIETLGNHALCAHDHPQTPFKIGE